MPTYRHFQRLSVLGVLVLLGFLITQVDTDKLSGAPSSDECLFTETAFSCQISGTITDVSSGMPVQNAKISLLDPSNRDVLSADIYTDESGTYEAAVEVEFTDVSQQFQKAPLSYWISEPQPNPVSAVESNGITIQYVTPGNRLVTPVLEVYNVLGKKVDYSGPLANGVYLYRLKFSDGNFSETKKMVFTSGGRLDVTLRQMFVNSKPQFRKETSPHHPGKVMSDSIEVLYVIEKDGYAYMELSKDLFEGVDNIHDFTMVPAYEEISAVIDESGGTLEHPGGFSVEFQEGAFSSPVSVTVSKTDLPGALPSGITASSSSFSVNTGGVKPENCAILSFQISSQTQNGDEGTLGIYRWSGEAWQYAGGNAVGDTVSVYMRNFSTFLAGTADTKIHRIFRFENGGPNNAMVYVWAYLLLHPGLDAPIARDLGTPCFTAPYAPPVGGNQGWYPQGFYQFCADWIDDVYGPRYRIIGGNPPHWSYSLGEYTSLIVPPEVFVNTSIAGSLPGLCPVRITQVSLPNTGIAGNWTGTLPPPWGTTNLQITGGYLIFSTSLLTETYPFVLVNSQEQYIILLNYDGEGYMKIEWNIVGENEISLSWFIASYEGYVTHPTIEDAINDTTPEIENALFTRTDGAS